MLPSGQISEMIKSLTTQEGAFSISKSKNSLEELKDSGTGEKILMIKKQNDKGLKWRHHKKFNKIKEGDEPITS